MSEPTVAIVTGASQGIGLAIARDLARRGSIVNISSGSRVQGSSLKGRVLARDMVADDLVGAVAFFVGHESAFITGQTLVVDGGSYFH